MAQKPGDEITLTQAVIAIGGAGAVIAGLGFIALKLVGLL
jgi:hypothetical protein